MLKLYKYLYYRLYSWNLKTWGEGDSPQWNAMLGVSSLMFANLSLVGLLLQFFFGIQFYVRGEVPRNEIIAIMLCLFIVNYFWLVYKGKYKAISKEFEKEAMQKRKRNTVLLWLYAALSFALLLFVAILYGKLNGWQ